MTPLRLIGRIEDSPLWWLGRLLIPVRYRVFVCKARGRHHPVIVGSGRKCCPDCGGW